MSKPVTKAELEEMALRFRAAIEEAMVVSGILDYSAVKFVEPEKFDEKEFIRQVGIQITE